MKNGERFEGLLAGSTLPAASAKITLKMTKKLAGDAPSSNGIASREAALIGSSPDHAMTFEVKDLADIQIPEFSIPQPTKMANGQ